MEKVYIAYGSNMNMEQMERRCPNAKPIGRYMLKDYKLEFRGVANIIKCAGAETPVALWKITDICEKSLDRYEGFPRLYRKEYIKLEIEDEDVVGMVYVMNIGEIAPPSEYYYKVIEKGYKDFKLETTPLKKALVESKRVEKEKKWK